MNPIRIGFYIENYLAGGLERLLFDLLEDLPRSRYAVTLFYHADDQFMTRFRRMGIEHVQVIPIRVLTTKPWEDWVFMRRPSRILWRLFLAIAELARWIFAWANIRRCRRAFRQTPQDILQTINGGYPAAISCQSAVIAAKKENIPVTLLCFTGIPRPRYWEAIEKRFDRCVQTHVDKAISVSSKGGAYLAERRHFEVDKIKTIHCGISRIAQPSYGRVNELRRSLRLGEGPIIGNVSVLEPYKGQALLLEAVEVLKPKFPALQCLIIGKGKERAVLETFVRDHELSQQVLLLGYVEDYFPHLKLLDIFVHPTLEDSFPYVILEAMALGKAIVATDVGGIPEQIENGQSGMVIPPGNVSVMARAIEELLGSPTKAKQYGENAQRRYEARFTLQRMVDDYDRLYQNIMNH